MTPSDAATGSGPAARRLGELLGLPVLDRNGDPLGHVNDVRVVGPLVAAGRTSMKAVGLVVSDRHAGSLLGYDRRSDQGPWLVRRIVRRLHRDAGYVPWESVVSIDWDGRRVVTAAATLEPLEAV